MRMLWIWMPSGRSLKQRQQQNGCERIDSWQLTEHHSNPACSFGKSFESVKQGPECNRTVIEWLVELQLSVDS